MKSRFANVTILAAAISLASCAGAYERCIKPVTSQITWTGSAAELSDVVAQFLLCDGGSPAMAPACALADLEALASSLGPEGAQVVNCLLKYHAENGTAKVRERARAVGAKRGVNMSALKCGGAGKVVLRSPGEAKPPTSPGTTMATGIEVTSGRLALSSEIPIGRIVFLSNVALPILILSEGHGSACYEGMHEGIPAFPGLLCVRDGLSWSDVAQAVRKSCADMHGCDMQASRGRSPLADAIADSLVEWAHAEIKPARRDDSMGRI